MSPPVAAVFDMDGLLVDSEPLWRRAEIAIFGRYGVPLTEEGCRTTKGMFVGEVARHWHARYPWEGPSPAAVATEVTDAMEVLLADEVELKSGVHHALAFCRQRGVSIALASSSARRLIDVVVRRFGLGEWFDVVHSAETEAAGKPDPAVFLSTAVLLDVAPGGCVVFEDSSAGVAAAAAAGMRCVAVPDGHAWGPGALRCRSVAGADAVIESLEAFDEALWEHLERLGG
ncbi:MAG: HAD-IA family hydrolase [Acidimicrobiales bacterium]